MYVRRLYNIEVIWVRDIKMILNHWWKYKRYDTGIDIHNLITTKINDALVLPVCINACISGGFQKSHCKIVHKYYTVHWRERLKADSCILQNWPMPLWLPFLFVPIGLFEYLWNHKRFVQCGCAFDKNILKESILL